MLGMIDMEKRQVESKMNKIRDAEPEKVLYVIGWILLVFFILLFFVLRGLSNRYAFFSMPCVYYELLGMYCPGCGGTRSMLALLSGNLGKSILYHPFVPYLLIFSGVFMVSQTLRVISKDRIPGIKFRMVYIYIGVILLILQWIVKNILLLGFHTDLLSSIS